MGRLTYNSTLDAYFDDRTLAHLQAVISVKLRHLESFALSWRDANGVGAGRNVIWLHPNVSLVYKFTSSRVQDLNPIWLGLLLDAANSADGLSIMPEPDAEPSI